MANHLQNANMPIRKHPGRHRAARELVGHLDLTMRRLLLGAADEGAAIRVSRSEIAVLDTLGAEGPMAIGELAGRVRLPLSTATRLVDRLVTRGLVARERTEENRRIVRVSLAAGGRAFYRAARRGRIAGAERMLERLNESERRELVRLFRKIAASILEKAEQ